MERERFIELPGVTDRRGSLSFIETGEHIPFNISYTYCIYNPPGEISEMREKVIIALSGSFHVVVDDRYYALDSCASALYIPDGMPCRLDNFSADAICLNIISELSEDNRMRESVRQHPQLNTIDDCSLIELSVFRNEGGSIIRVNNSENTPFDTKRIFYIYDIPPGETRGMHAHKLCHEVLIAVSGSFEVELDDGMDKKMVLLDRPDYGLYIPPGVWASESSYSPGTICLALASDVYDAENYINTYSDFKKYRENEN